MDFDFNTFLIIWMVMIESKSESMVNIKTPDNLKSPLIHILDKNLLKKLIKSMCIKYIPYEFKPKKINVLFDTWFFLY